MLNKFRLKESKTESKLRIKLTGSGNIGDNSRVDNPIDLRLWVAHNFAAECSFFTQSFDYGRFAWRWINNLRLAGKLC